MKKLLILTIIMMSFGLQAQITANRFFYELNFKPKMDSTRVDKVMVILDIVPEKSLYRDYTNVSQDSLIKAEVENMKRSGVFKDVSKVMKMPKFAYKVTKKYPSMDIVYSEGILNGMQSVQLGYVEKPAFNWKIMQEKEKIGAYDTQKATATYGGRDWTAWFTTEVPFPDGPYKFSGLPGLIVKIEDTDKDYSWELKGNEQINDWKEQSYIETISPGGAGKLVEVSREKFEKTLADYKKDPFSSFRSQMTPEIMKQKMPGSEKTIGDMIKDQEKRVKDFYNANANPIERTPSK